jgi:acyl-[acyl-carrier-protein]-phospholipid O-acyltransferase/long-chain-fatty-acid--[acyl-carrier-protein] ligase
MHDGTFRLLAHRRFWPLFVAQFLGAANDNLFKNALAILIVFRLGDGVGMAPQVLVSLAAGLFILPYFLFSATAGQVSDRYEKSRLMRRWKLIEVVISVIGAWSLIATSVVGMLAVLFLLGVQSTFYSPIKYAVLPELLEPDELIGGNALIEGGTFLAILLGTIAGGTLVLVENGTLIVSAASVGLAVAGFLASLAVPRVHPGNPALVIGGNVLRETGVVLGLVRRQRDLYLSVLGISWFWLVGATYLAQFPSFAKDVLAADQHVVTLLLTMFSVGIGVGSVLCGRLLKGEVSARHVPFAALGMTLFGLDLWLASGGGATEELAGLAAFLARPSSWRVLADLLAFAVCGGLYIVPLYAILQSRSDEKVRSQVVAANNIVNAGFMVVSAVAASALLALDFTVPEVFLTVALANLAVAIYICGLLPDAVLKGLFAAIFRLLWRAEVRGLENLQAAGPRAVIVVNHVSFMDAALLAAFLPGKPVFAINTLMARQWWVKPFLSVIRAFPIDPTNPMSTKSLIHEVAAGNHLIIFPEGRLTVTGALMKIYEGPGMIADRAGAPLVPVRIDGAQFTPFSRLKGKVRLRWFPPVRITVLPPQYPEVPPEIKGRARRQRISVKLYDIMSAMMFATANHPRSLFAGLLEAAHLYGGGAPAVEDIGMKPLSYDQLIMASLALGRALSRRTAAGEAVGLLLPNMNGAAVAFFALQAFGRVPAMLNFSTGAGTVLAACGAARIRTVLTSRRFIDQARLGAMIEALNGAVSVTYLEDIRAGLTLSDRLYGLLGRRLAGRLHRRWGVAPDQPAVILFTSGSEGTPKGVVLSHANILANCAQIAARVAFTPSDIVFNALPVFHSFGLTGGFLLPVLAGIKCFLYPSPLHYRIVPELVYDRNATIMFGTDTFLAGYARVANAYDFYSIRYVFAGAEKVKDSTRQIWMEKFGLRLLEGYGATETAPVIAVNTPMHFKAGTVGRILPGIESRLEAVPGIEDGRRLWVKGPNVMLGYYRVERPGQLEPPPEGWYDTGDIVTIDDLGYVRIVGRAKRFAKIAGEMVSLGRIEAELAVLWPGRQHAVVAVPDDRKGEQLVLITDQPGAAREAVLAHFRGQGLAELLVPRTVLAVDKVPLLGTGKTDYVAVAALVALRNT